MSKYLVTCAVNFDGRGDWTHCRDILQFMQAQNELSGITFIPLIVISNKKHPSYNCILSELAALDFPYYLGGTQCDFLCPSEKRTELIALLPDIDQVIIVSNDVFYRDPFFREYFKAYLKPDVLIKIISEHEGGTVAPDGRDALRILSSRQNFMIRAMGLNDFCYGINVKNSAPIDQTTAWEVIQANDPGFVSDLLRITQSENVSAFLDNHLFIPAYFNYIKHFSSFIGFLATNASIPKQNIAIYLSSQSLSTISIIEELEGNETEINASNIASSAFKGIKQFELNEPGKEPSIYHLAREGRTIRLYMGYYLSDPSFAAAFNGANFLVGVSGDNTFQDAVAKEIFPFYCSTNIHLKRGTLPAIGRISQLEELDIPPSVRDDYDYFFNDNNFWRRLINRNERGVFNHINLPKMIEFWPTVAKYIKTRCNIQTRLLQIILEKPDGLVEQKPVRMDGKVITYDLLGIPRLITKEKNVNKTQLPSPRKRYEFMLTPAFNDDEKFQNYVGYNGY